MKFVDDDDDDDDVKSRIHYISTISFALVSIHKK